MANLLAGFSRAERVLIRRAGSAEKIQDLVNRYSSNFELAGDTYWSPRQMLRARCGHCLEGALLALLIFRCHNITAGLVDLKAVKDLDHVICAYRRRGRWGAVSKTNHAVLRYREPVYRTLRELAMSYFHEYRDNAGYITLRSYSRLVKPEQLDRAYPGWAAATEKLEAIALCVDEARHYPVLAPRQRLRRADPIERYTGSIVEWRRQHVRTRLPARPRR